MPKEQGTRIERIEPSRPEKFDCHAEVAQWFKTVFGGSFEEIAEVRPGSAVEAPTGAERISIRSFPRGGLNDTMYTVPGERNYEHETKAKVFADSEILAVHLRPEEFDLRLVEGGDHVPFGRYDQRSVMQQIGWRGCVATSTAMLILDAGKVPSAHTIAMGNLSSDELVEHMLRSVGLKMFKVTLAHRPEGEALDILSQMTRFNGPAIIDLDCEVGGHVVVLDQLDLKSNRARLRDPFHGWAISVSADALLKRLQLSSAIWSAEK